MSAFDPQEMIDEADKDGDGEVSEAEFSKNYEEDKHVLNSKRSAIASDILCTSNSSTCVCIPCG